MYIYILSVLNLKTAFNLVSKQEKRPIVIFEVQFE